MVVMIVHMRQKRCETLNKIIHVWNRCNKKSKVVVKITSYIDDTTFVYSAGNDREMVHVLFQNEWWGYYILHRDCLNHIDDRQSAPKTIQMFSDSLRYENEMKFEKNSKIGFQDIPKKSSFFELLILSGLVPTIECTSSLWECTICAFDFRFIWWW